MNSKEILSEKMSKVLENNLWSGDYATVKGGWAASKECADVAIQYAIDVLREVQDDVGGAKNARKISELQSLLKQPQP